MTNDTAVAHSDAVSAERLMELEIRIAYQEDTIAQLNDALISQQRQIDALVSRTKMLAERLTQQLQQADRTAPYSAEEEQPPHY